MATVRNVTVRLTATNAMSRGINSAQRSMRSLAATSAKLGKTTLIRTGQVAALSALAGAAAQSAASIIQLGAAIAPAAGLLAALPGAALLAGAGVVTLKVALSGLGDAFGAALSGNQEKFDKALDKMGPAARQVALEFKGIVPALLGIRNAVQGAFFGPLHGQLTATAAVLAGPLKVSMAGVAAEFGKGARSILEWVRQAQTVGAIQSIFSRLRQTVAAVRPAITPLLTGFLDLATVGARFISYLGPGFATLVKRFGEWMTAAAKSGRAFEWMSAGLVVVKQLGQVLGNVLGILKSVFGAASASGGNLLGTFAQLTGALNAFLKTSEGASVLRSIFQGISGIGKALGPVVIALAKGLGQVAPAVGRIAEAVGPVLVTAIDALAPALKGLEPGITALIKGMGGAFKALGPALLPLAQAISAIAVAVAPVLPAMGQLVAMLVAGLANVILKLVASGALDSIVQAIIKLGFALGNALLDALTAVAPYLPDLVTSMSQLLIAIIPLLPSIIQLVIQLAPLIPIITDAIVILTQLANIVIPIVTQAIKDFSGVVSALVGVVRWVWDNIAGVIKDQIEKISRNLSDLGALPGKFRKWFGQAKEGAIIIVNRLNDYMGGVPGRILSAVGNLGDLLWGAGRNVMIGLWNGIASMAGWIASSISSLVRNIIPEPVRRALNMHSPSRVMAGLGVHIAEGLAVGMTGAQGLVARAAEGLAGAAVPAMAGGPAMSTPVGLSRSAGSGAQQGIDYRQLAGALVAAMRSEGVGAVHLDGQLISDNVSRRTGRATEQRRRTG